MKVIKHMKKIIVHYVGFLMSLLFMLTVSCSTVYAEENIKNEDQKLVVVPKPVDQTQIYLVLYRDLNICQATMINLGKMFSISLATMKNIDPTLPAIESLATLIKVSQQRYTQLALIEQGVVKELQKAKVPQEVAVQLGTNQFNQTINLGMRMLSNAHANPPLVEGFISTLLQQNVQCEANITDRLEQLKELNGPPTGNPQEQDLE